MAVPKSGLVATNVMEHPLLHHSDASPSLTLGVHAHEG